MVKSSNSPKRFVRETELRARLGNILDTTLWRLTRRGVLPLPGKLGGLNVWSDDVVDEVVDRLANSNL
jgi:predicted DNA-binding transcriptional regulator AlpA